MSISAPLADRYVPAAQPTTVRFHIPSKDRRRRPQTVEGTLKGAMHMRGAVHHYRVAGTDGVLYLAPVAWFVPGHIEWFSEKAFVTQSSDADRRRSLMISPVQEMKAHLDARDRVMT